MANAVPARRRGPRPRRKADATNDAPLIRQLSEIGRDDGDKVGGKGRLARRARGRRAADRDSDRLRRLFDERDEAVTAAIADLLAKARRAGAKTGICGQAPSDHPELARFLVGHGIDSISVSPDSFLAVKQHVADAERRRSDSAA